ncbi:unnamed protein product, partial [Amoebophrya sp. A25]|eukprot:GSA25T00003766001.1
MRENLKAGFHLHREMTEKKQAQKFNRSQAAAWEAAASSPRTSGGGPSSSTLLSKSSKPRSPAQNSEGLQVVPLVVPNAGTLYAAIGSHYQVFYRYVIERLVDKVGNANLSRIAGRPSSVEQNTARIAIRVKKGIARRLGLYLISQQTGVPLKELEKYSLLRENPAMEERTKEEIEVDEALTEHVRLLPQYKLPYYEPLMPQNFWDFRPQLFDDMGALVF